MRTRILAGLLFTTTLAGAAIAQDPAPTSETAPAPPPPAAAPAPAAPPPRSVTGDTLVIEESVAPKSRPAKLPARGMTMSQVRAGFGEPQSKHGPIGKPPITRWEYPEFRVVFEHSHVLTAVVPGAPSQIHHREQLQPK